MVKKSAKKRTPKKSVRRRRPTYDTVYDQKAFWENCAIASLVGGATATQAVKQADDLLEAQRERWGRK